jgi:hypothetical protein
MTTTTLIPGLTLTDNQYELAASAVAQHAPDLGPLTREAFLDLPKWCLVPDDRGELSKAEYTLLATEDRTAKLNLWYRADTRGGVKPLPHNHRWQRFTSHILSGGYDEDRYDLRDDERAPVASASVSHVAGRSNTVLHDTYHEVVAIHDPGATMTLMACGYGRFGDWCHLDVDSGRLVKGQPVADFERMFDALNPHLRR